MVKYSTLPYCTTVHPIYKVDTITTCWVLVVCAHSLCFESLEFCLYCHPASSLQSWKVLGTAHADIPDPAHSQDHRSGFRIQSSFPDETCTAHNEN